MIGQFLRATSRTVNRSGICASIFCAGVLLSGMTRSAAAQVPTAPDTARADTVTRVLVLSDTTKEVKHVVKKGDTLWDLAQFYLKNPFRWPEIFRRNTDVVKNPHWIYPGEVIRIWGTEVKTTALLHADSAGEVVSHVATREVPLPTTVQNVNTGPRSELTIFASPMSRAAAAIQSDVIGRAPSGAVRRGEVEAAPYADREGGPKGAGRLVSSVDRPGIKTSIVQSRYQLNDDLFIDLPRGSVARLGDLYMSFVLGPDLAEFGQVVVPTGILRIETMTPGQRPVARIIRQYGEIKLEEGIIPAPEIGSLGGMVELVVGGPRGKVIYVQDDPVLPSIGHYVLTSINAKSGIKVGDEVTFIDNSTGTEDSDKAPPVVAGNGQVVRVTPFATTVVIVRQVQPTIREGMPVHLTGKTP